MYYFKLGLTLLCIAYPLYSGISIKICNNTHHYFQITSRVQEPKVASCIYEVDALRIKPLQSRQVAWIDDQTIKKDAEIAFDLTFQTDNDHFICKHLLNSRKKDMISYAVTKPLAAQLTWHTDTKYHKTPIFIQDKAFVIFSRKINVNSKNIIIEYIFQENKPEEPSELPEQLKILSWNIDIKPPSYVKNDQHQRALLIPEHLHDYDVLVLTDIFDISLLQAIQQKLKNEYPYNSLQLTAKSKATQNSYESGIALFSKWPLEESKYHLFQELCSGYDCRFKRGVVYTRIHKRGFVYHIFGVSLQDWPSNESALVRTEQLKRVKELIADKEISHKEPIIIAGSFFINKYKSSFDDKNRNEYQEMLTLLNADFGQQKGYLFTIDPAINSLARSIDPKEYSDYILCLSTHKKPKQFVLETRIFKTIEPWNKRSGEQTSDLSSHFAICGMLEF